MNWKALTYIWLLLVLGVFVASGTTKGIGYDNVGSLFFAAVVLSFLNIFLKPLLMLFSLPFILLTFGLGIWLINALLFLLLGVLVSGFYVESFWHALWGAFVLSLTQFVASLFFGSPVRRQPKPGVRVEFRSSGTRPPRRAELKDDDDVIDV